MTEAQRLEDHCRNLQRHLRLQDWNVILGCKRFHEMPDGLLGQCEWNLPKKEAFINILCQEDRDARPFSSTELDTLVHELIHLHFAPFWDDANKIEMEQAIECLSQAFGSCYKGVGFVSVLDRAKGKKPTQRRPE